METSVKTIQQGQFKVAEIRVSYKPAFNASERPQTNSSDEAVMLFKASWKMNTYLPERRIQAAYDEQCQVDVGIG